MVVIDAKVQVEIYDFVQICALNPENWIIYNVYCKKIRNFVPIMSNANSKI